MKNVLLLIAFVWMSSFAAKYYVDGGLYYDGTETGASGDPFGGACGMQKAMSTISAGDTVFVNDTVWTERKRTVAYDGLVGTFAAGETITNTTQTGTAVIYTDNGSNSMVIEVLTGTFDNDNRFNNGAGEDTASVNTAPVMAGILVGTDGTNAAPIFIYGATDAWALDSTVYGIIYGRALSKTWETTAMQWYVFQNMKWSASSTQGINRVSGSNQYCYFTNCAWEDNTSDGMKNVSLATFNGCTISGNGSNGINGTTQLIISNCLIRNNGTTGMSGTGNSMTINSIVSRCGTTGITVGSNSLISNCIIDSCVNGVKTWTIDQEAMFITKTRITNCSTTGILMQAGDNLLLGPGVVLLGNATATAGGVIIAPYGTITSGVQGYENRAGYIYNLTTTATARRFAAHVGAY